MAPQSRCVGDRGIAILAEKMDKLCFGKDSRLGETVHASANFNVDFAFVNNVVQIIMVDDFLWDLVEGDEHVFVVGHGGAKVVVFDV